MTSIPNSPKKIKYQLIIVGIGIVFLASSAAFALGRWSVSNVPAKAPLTFEKSACLVPRELVADKGNLGNTQEQASKAQGAFVASKSGTKFYPADCSYADRILPQNKIWFITEQDAQAAGYEVSTQCASDE